MKATNKRNKSKGIKRKEKEKEQDSLSFSFPNSTEERVRKLINWITNVNHYYVQTYLNR